MINQNCKKCNHKQNTINGNCKILADDGYVARCAPFWTDTKHKAIENYSNMITVGMKNKFEEINYVDLYSGPGKYFNRETGELHDGSPLISLKCKYTKIFLNDLSKENVDALIFRTRENDDRLNIFESDANEIASEINSRLNQKSLTFCLIDPNKMSELKFETIKKLTENRLVDLLINFAYQMDFKRGSAVAKTRAKEKYSEFFNTDEWIGIQNTNKSGNISFVAEKLIELYRKQLKSIGYIDPPIGKEYKATYHIGKTETNILYYLIYASKNAKGYDFCKKMRPYTKPQGEFNL